MIELLLSSRQRASYYCKHGKNKIQNTAEKKPPLSFQNSHGCFQVHWNAHGSFHMKAKQDGKPWSWHAALAIYQNLYWSAAWSQVQYVQQNQTNISDKNPHLCPSGCSAKQCFTWESPLKALECTQTPQFSLRDRRITLLSSDLRRLGCPVWTMMSLLLGELTLLGTSPAAGDTQGVKTTYLWGRGRNNSATLLPLLILTVNSWQQVKRT